MYTFGLLIIFFVMTHQNMYKKNHLSALKCKILVAFIIMIASSCTGNELDQSDKTNCVQKTIPPITLITHEPIKKKNILVAIKNNTSQTLQLDEYKLYIKINRAKDKKGRIFEIPKICCLEDGYESVANGMAIHFNMLHQHNFIASNQVLMLQPCWLIRTDEAAEIIIDCLLYDGNCVLVDHKQISWKGECRETKQPAIIHKVYHGISDTPPFVTFFSKK